MQIKQKSLLQFHNIKLCYGSRTILNKVTGSILQNDKIGLVGPNGCGKSSLLQILAGVNDKFKGKLSSSANTCYLPQIELLRNDMNLSEYLAERIDDWWDVLLEYKKLFGKDLSIEQSVVSLSGGELLKLNFSILISQKPDILLLDEPTNHLDLTSKTQLSDYLQKTKTTFVVVSHDTAFLNKVTNTTWALENARMIEYGGNYSFYQEERKKKLEAKKKRLKSKKKKLAKIRKARQLEHKRRQRSKSFGRKIAKTGGTDGFAQEFFKNKSQKKYGSKKVKYEKKERKLEEDIKNLKPQRSKSIHVDIKSQNKKGLLVSVEKAQLMLPDGKELISDLSLNLYHKDRVAILGDNGSGKTTLVQQLAYQENKFIKGKVNYGNKYKTLFVNQNYKFLKFKKSIIQNIQTSKINYQTARKILGNFDFRKKQDTHKKVKDLSGGEMARVAFAKATTSNVDLLILDEPTNNIDIQTKEVISESLQNFQGTIVVISHDIDFLKSININKSYQIEDKKLEPTSLDDY